VVCSSWLQYTAEEPPLARVFKIASVMSLSAVRRCGFLVPLIITAEYLYMRSGKLNFLFFECGVFCTSLGNETHPGLPQGAGLLFGGGYEPYSNYQQQPTLVEVYPTGRTVCSARRAPLQLL
jgi:hypothetical protein